MCIALNQEIVYTPIPSNVAWSISIEHRQVVLARQIASTIDFFHTP
jgi:hypothetical protein